MYSITCSALLFGFRTVCFIMREPYTSLFTLHSVYSRSCLGLCTSLEHETHPGASRLVLAHNARRAWPHAAPLTQCTRRAGHDEPRILTINVISINGLVPVFSSGEKKTSVAVLIGGSILKWSNFFFLKYWWNIVSNLQNYLSNKYFLCFSISVWT